MADYRQYEENGCKVWEFPDLTSYLDVALHGKGCEQPLRSESDRASRARKTGYGQQFYHYNNWEDCCRATREGDPELRKRVATIKDRQLANTLRVVEVPSYTRTEEPAEYFDPALVVEGEPAHWYEPSVSTVSVARTVKLVVNMTASCSVANETLVKRGAAITALSLALSACNVPHEIWVVCTVNHETTYETRILVKPMGTLVQEDLLAFVLMAPDMLRRVQFSAAENLRWPSCGVYGSYGFPCDTRFPGDVVIQGNGGALAKVADLDAWVTDQTRRLIEAAGEFAGA